MKSWLLRFKSEQAQKVLWPVVALCLILLFNLFFTPGFFRIEIKDGHLFGSLVDILNRGAPTLLLALGMTLVYATGGVDLSVGSILAISGALAAYLIRPGYANGILEYPDPPTSILIAVALPILLSLAAGAWNGFLVAYLDIQPIIATLILMVAGRGIAQLITKGQIVIFIHKPFEFVGGGFLFGLPFPVVLTIIMIALTFFLTRKTALGMFIEAVGANPTASRFMGLQAQKIKLMLYIFSGFCSGLAGLMICSNIRGADANNAGLFLELDAIASVIIGGTMNGGRFTLAGSVVGALIIQSLTTTILTRGIAPEVTLVYKAIVIILVVLIQSENFRKLLTGYVRAAKTNGATIPAQSVKEVK